MESSAAYEGGWLSRRKIFFWRVVQVAVWGVGMFIWAALILNPPLGLHLLWNVLIPVAPALLVLAPGVWRNVCPLGSMSLMPHHLGVSQDRQLRPGARSRLFVAAIVLLLLVVPLRKVALDTNGPLLAAVLVAVGLLAIWQGVIFKWKSGWCSSLCPVYPVELLYGSAPLVSVPNAHCSACAKCVAPCSESTVGLAPANATQTLSGRKAGRVFTGCFPGFVWGWYQVPTYSGWEGLGALHEAYGIPFAAGAMTLTLFVFLRRMWPQHSGLIGRYFAAAAIITYYWFRLPPIFGIGDPSAAMIVDISPWLPAWSAAALRVMTIIIFGWLIVGRPGRLRAWEQAPRPVRSTLRPAPESSMAV